MRPALWYSAVVIWAVGLTGGLVAGLLGSCAVLVLVPVGLAAAAIVFVGCYGLGDLLKILACALVIEAGAFVLGQVMPEPLAELLALAGFVAVVTRRRVIWRRRVARAMDRITFV
jgi:hypothetical protein